MSERGTFVTSFLYDYPTLVPILRRLLPKVCRAGNIRPSVALVEGVFGDADAIDGERTRFFAGLMHGTYQAEEAHEMESFIYDELLPALPPKHGAFSITVSPEWEEYTTVFSIKDRELTIRKVK